jgi:hypothetical protein
MAGLASFCATKPFHGGRAADKRFGSAICTRMAGVPLVTCRATANSLPEEKLLSNQGDMKQVTCRATNIDVVISTSE